MLERRRRRSRPSTSWRRTASPATSGATPRARCTSRTRRWWSSSPRSPRRSCSRRCCCRSTTTTRAIASAASRMTWPQPATGRASRWARGAPTRRPRSRRPGRRTSPASRRRPTWPPGGATASRPPAPARTASRCCTTREADAFRAQVDSLGKGTTLLVDTYDIAEAVRTGVEVAGPELGAVRLDSGDLGALAARGAGPARLARRDQHPDRRDQRPRRVRDRGAGRRAGRRLRRRHPAGHRQRAPDVAASSTSWSPARRRSGELEPVAKKSVDKVSVGGRKWALRRRTADGRRRGRGHRHRRRRPRTTATTGRCWCRWSATARSSAGSRSRPPASGTSWPAPSCRRTPTKLSDGDPVIPTVFEGEH